MSDTSRIRVSYVEEVSFGVFPSANLQDLRLTQEGLRGNANFITSAEIRADRQTPNVRRSGLHTLGPLNFELSFLAQDALLEASLFSSDWAAEVETVSGDTAIAAVATGNKYTGVDEEFAGYAVNQWVRVSGFANAANNGLAKITAINSSNPGVSDNDELVVAGLTLVNESATPPITITQAAYIQNGTEARSFSFEKHYQDLTNEYAKYSGVMFDSLQLSVVREQLVTGVIETLGKLPASATSSGGTGYTLAPTNQPLSAVDDIDAVLENYTTYGATQFTVQLQNKLRQRIEIGTETPISLGSGFAEVTGTLQAYFSSKAIMDKFLNATTSSLAILATDPDGNSIIIDLPRIVYTGGQRIAGGQDQDIMADMTYRAYMHPTELVTMRIAKIAA